MGTYTPNLNLYKPDASDDFGSFRAEFNDNMDKLDNGGGGGGHTIVDENGSDMPAESKLQFTGNVSVTDDNVNGATVVDVLGGGGNVYGAFIDPSRIIVSSAYTSNLTYTATEDCFFFVGIASSPNSSSQVYIDGEQVYGNWNGSGGVLTETPIFPMKKGQTITVNATYGSSSAYIVYGITQGTNGIYAPVIYSDNERVIGVWRDNKPLYAKTWVLTVPSATGTYSFNEATPNLENVVHTEYSLWGLGERGETPWYTPATISFSEQTASYIEFYFASSNYAGRKIYYTSYYTKTTDVAGSGNWNTDGVPTHHYSTSEQVVGTWIDNKPLYERVLELTQDTNLIADTWVKTEFNQTTMKALIKAVAVIGSSGAVIEALSGGFIDGKIALNSARNVGLNVADSARLIVQYTKSTD